jgi:predicted Fe-Mo cluster-binding NifX family protein
MRLAIPLENGRLCQHFGHCQQFAMIEADPKTKTIGPVTFITPPPHAPGQLPGWLHQQGAELVIAGGMGDRAVQLLKAAGVGVILGATSDDPSTLAKAWLAGSLVDSGSVCDQHGSGCDDPDHQHQHQGQKGGCGS